MTKDDLIPGQVYTDGYVIFKSIKRELGIGFRISGEAFREMNNWGLELNQLRLANYNEIIWLEACIKANTFVSKPENIFNDNYEIY